MIGTDPQPYFQLFFIRSEHSSGLGFSTWIQGLELPLVAINGGLYSEI
jgi:hypothetical protein